MKPFATFIKIKNAISYNDRLIKSAFAFFNETDQIEFYTMADGEKLIAEGFKPIDFHQMRG